jgi:hypothetical protein
MDSFSKLRAQVNCLDVTDEARGLALTLLAVLEGQLPAPAEALRGYWPTVRLYWGNGAVEIEVHDGWYELYHFQEGATDIREFKPGDVERLLNTASTYMDVE